MEIQIEHTDVFEWNYDAYNSNKRFIINQGGSRCHGKDTLIRMYDGTLKKVQDIVVGDKVASMDGMSFNTVIETHSGIDDMYLIKQCKGKSYTVNKNHILCLKQTRPKPYKKYVANGVRKEFFDAEYDKEKIHYFTAEEYSKLSDRTRRMYCGFKNTFIELDKKELPIDPYYLGLWLGDGTSTFGGQITTADKEIVDYMDDFREDDTYLWYDNKYTYSIRSTTFNKQTELSKEFYKLNLIKNKHIPSDYIYTCYEDRLKLIAGLIDSDGTCNRRRTLSFTNTNKKIVEGLYELLMISGFYTRGIRNSISKMKRKDGSVYEVPTYDIEFNHPDFKDLNKYIKLKRKRVVKNRYENFNMYNTKIESEFIGQGEYFGFTLDKDPHYKLEDGTITHNSSKTYSILQLLVILCLTTPKLSCSIVRKSFPSLRGSVMRDLFEIIKELNIYKVSNHNKTEHIYKFDNGSFIEFFSVDDDQKVRGRKRDVCYINEGNELTFEEFNQLNMRTTKSMFIDFNPSDTESFLYGLISNENSILIKSTYKNNPFLSKSIVEEIENLINVSPEYYRIYCLGERATLTTRVYTHFKQYVDEMYNIDEVHYGLDIGFNHPMALVESKFIDNRVYVKELIYESGLTTNDLIMKMELIGIDKKRNIWVDSARPDVIEDLRRKGFKAFPADKAVKEGIDSVKSMEVFVHIESVNLWKEYKTYSYKTDGDRILDEVVKMNDDGVDSLRYSVHSHKKHKKITKRSFYIG
jgi:phage terminase large subunit